MQPFTVWIGAFIMLVATSAAFGNKADKQEVDAVERWVAEHFSRGLPISFSYNGKPCDMKAWTMSESPLGDVKDGKRRELVWTDPATKLEVHCELTEFHQSPAVEWVLTLKNGGNADTPIIENLDVLDARFPVPAGPLFFQHPLGDRNSAASFALADDAVPTNGRAFELSPRGGRSSDFHLPFFDLHWAGGGVIVAVGWSGQWAFHGALIAPGQFEIKTGQQLTHFRLQPGESVRTPRVVLLFWQGDDQIRGNNLFRQWLLINKAPRDKGEVILPPLCASVSYTAKDGSYEKPHLDAMPAYAKLGLEMFWSDMDPQHWYPGGFPNGTGNWHADKGKYPHGLGPIGKAAHDAGIGYLLWVEPERVAKGTQVALEHPEFIHGGAGGGLFKLDDPEARAWIAKTLDDLINEAHVDWLRWDFNIEPLLYWRKNDAPDRQGITEMKYIAGLYELWDGLRERHPGLMIDNCASGGRRLDIETSARAIPLWHSDMQCNGPSPTADQLQNSGLWRWLPMHGTAVFSVENTYVFHSELTAGNVIVPADGPPDSPAKARPEYQAAMKNAVALYKKLRPLMLGDFYPLLGHADAADVWHANQFDRPDLGAGVAMIFRREKCVSNKATIKLHGIDLNAKYEISILGVEETHVMDGKELAAYPIEIAAAPGSVVLFYAKK